MSAVNVSELPQLIPCLSCLRSPLSSCKFAHIYTPTHYNLIKVSRLMKLHFTKNWCSESKPGGPTNRGVILVCCQHQSTARWPPLSWFLWVGRILSIDTVKWTRSSLHDVWSVAAEVGSVWLSWSDDGRWCSTAGPPLESTTGRWRPSTRHSDSPTSTVGYGRCPGEFERLLWRCSGRAGVERLISWASFVWRPVGVWRGAGSEVGCRASRWGAEIAAADPGFRWIEQTTDGAVFHSGCPLPQMESDEHLSRTCTQEATVLPPLSLSNLETESRQNMDPWIIILYYINK